MDDVKVVAVGGAGTGLFPGTSVEGVTPSGTPNIAMQVVGPAVAIFVRFLHLFFVTAGGILTAAGVDKVSGLEAIPFSSFQDLLWKAAFIGACTALVGAVKDAGTLFGKLEQKFPFLTGNV